MDVNGNDDEVGGGYLSLHVYAQMCHLCQGRGNKIEDRTSG